MNNIKIVNIKKSIIVNFIFMIEFYSSNIYMIKLFYNLSMCVVLFSGLYHNIYQTHPTLHNSSTKAYGILSYYCHI